MEKHDMKKKDTEGLVLNPVYIPVENQGTKNRVRKKPEKEAQHHTQYIIKTIGTRK